MSRFTGPLIVEHLSVNPLHWKLVTPLYFEEGCKGSGRWIDVPIGRITDMASVPRFLWSVLPTTGRYARGAAVHDELYKLLREGTPHRYAQTRAACDRVLYQAARACGCNQLTCWTLWIGVRLGGWVFQLKAKKPYAIVDTEPPMDEL